MKVGHIFNYNDIEYCICDIQKLGDKEFAYAISGKGADTKISFFQLIYDNNGVLISEVRDEKLIVELFKLFLYVDDDDNDN